MHLHRRWFVAGITAALTLPSTAVPVRAAKHDDELAAHVHGLNGATIPGDKPINLKIRILDGPQFALQAYRGSVVVLNFFATWCPACREEAADVVRFAAEHAADTVVVSVDYREADDDARAWRTKYAVPYQIAMDEHGGFFAAIGLRYFPSTLFFRPDGTVSCVHPGSMDLADLEAERTLALAPDSAAVTGSPPVPPASAVPSPAPP